MWSKRDQLPVRIFHTVSKGMSGQYLIMNSSRIFIHVYFSNIIQNEEVAFSKDLFDRSLCKLFLGISDGFLVTAVSQVILHKQKTANSHFSLSLLHIFNKQGREGDKKIDASVYHCQKVNKYIYQNVK